MSSCEVESGGYRETLELVLNHVLKLSLGSGDAPQC